MRENGEANRTDDAANVMAPATVGGGEPMAPSTKRTTKAPAFQFYPSDFMNSPRVRRMSMTERGVYITLLCLDWMDDGLPPDLAQLAQDIHIPAKQLRGMWENGQLGQCFVEHRGRFRNARLIREREKQENFRRRQSDNGSKGGRPRKTDETHSKAMGFENETQAKARAMKTEDRRLKTEDLDSEIKEEIGVAFEKFQQAYPASRRKGGYLTANLFFEAVNTGRIAVDDIMDALANHKASEQWSDPKLIPGMDTWLREERWRQRLEPKGVAAPSSKLPAWLQKTGA